MENNGPDATPSHSHGTVTTHRIVAWTSSSSIQDLNCAFEEIITIKPLFTLPSGISNLLNFRTSLEARRDCSHSDPSTFVTDMFASRKGNGSQDLLCGVPVDPRSNLLHRHTVQYIDDFGLIPRISRSNSSSEIVISVSYGCHMQEKLDSSLCYFKGRLLIIALEQETAFRVDCEQFELTFGDIAIVPIDRFLQRKFKFIRGSAINVVLGDSASQFQGRVGFKSASSLVLSSVSYPSIFTANRKSQSLNWPQIACPDCRRPVEVVRSELKDVPKNIPQVLLTVVCDEVECAAAIASSGLFKEFKRKHVLVTDAKLLTPNLLTAWNEHTVTTVIKKYPQKRELTDYAVPEGFVSPILFPNSIDPPIKPTIYSLLQAIQCETLFATPILLIDADGDASVCIQPNKKTYELMLRELRDWNHPCHRGRTSAVSFVKEWVELYL